MLDGDDRNPLMDLGFTLELIHFRVEDRTDLLTESDVYLWVQISAGGEFLFDQTDTYRNQNDIDLNLVYEVDIADDGPPGAIFISGTVNFWEEKEPASAGVALDVCADPTDTNGFHFFFSYDIYSEEWSLYPISGAEAYVTGSGQYTVSGLDDGFSFAEETPVQDATLDFNMY